MAATITRGYTFGSTEQVTNTKLHNLVDSATIANIDDTNIASGYGLVYRSTSAPSNTNSLWVDTNFTPPVLKQYTGAEWQPTSSYGVFTNKSGGQLTAGTVVVADSSNDGAVNTTTTAEDPTVLGVLLETVADSADGVVALPGSRITAILVTEAVARGDRLVTSTTAGQAQVGGVNAFAIALDTTAGAGTLTEAVVIGTTLTPTGGGTTGQLLLSKGTGTYPQFGNSTVAWADVSGSSTITGWAATPTAAIYLTIVGNIAIISFNITGTSNATSASFTIPASYIPSSDVEWQGAYGTCVNAGTTKTGACRWRNNAGTIDLYTDMASAAWTGSGTKTVVGVIMYRVNGLG